MGYFNYFIKCIIRNIAYRLCKPKVFLTVLLGLAILFVLHSTGYCADWTDGEIEQCLNGLSDITSNQGVIISQLSSMGVNVSDIETELNEVNNLLSGISSTTSNISDKLTTVINRIDNLNTTLTQLAEQQNIYYENMSAEIRTIRDALVGSDDTPATLEYINIVNVSSVSGYTPGLRKYKIPFIKNYTYKINVTYANNENSTIYVGYFLSSLNISNEGNLTDASLNILGSIPANSSATFTIYARDDTKPYLYLTYGYNSISISATCSIEGIVDILDRTNQQVVDNIQQGNQLQQEQNQLQQEQNDLIKDDNVNTDGFEFATNDTNNPTEEGFNTLFTSIYSAFCNTSSAPLTITLPYVNETFTIQPNLVSNAMQKCGLGFVSTLIQSFYYYGVCLFIYKDINKIIEHLKSGNLTADCGNVKTEVL